MNCISPTKQNQDEYHKKIMTDEIIGYYSHDYQTSLFDWAGISDFNQCPAFLWVILTHVHVEVYKTIKDDNYIYRNQQLWG